MLLYAKFSAFQSQSQNNGLIWLDFSSQILLMVIGLILMLALCLTSQPYKNTMVNPIVAYGFIVLQLIDKSIMMTKI